MAVDNLNLILSKIKEVRTRKGLFHKDMADKLDLKMNTYNLLENGKIALTVERLFKIAEVLNVPVSELLGIEAIKTEHIELNNSNKIIKEQSLKIESLDRQIDILMNNIKLDHIHSEMNTISFINEIFRDKDFTEYDKEELLTKYLKNHNEIFMAIMQDNYISIETKRHISLLNLKYNFLPFIIKEL